MRTRVSVKGQTVIPIEIRRRYGIRAQTQLDWIDDGEVIFVRPVVPDSAEAKGIGEFRGTGLLEALLEGRRADRSR